MTSSELIWDYLERHKMTTRGEATEFFADILLGLIDDTSGSLSNGLVCDALESAINHLDQGDRVAQILKNGRNEQIKTKCLSESRKSVTPMKF